MEAIAMKSRCSAFLVLVLLGCGGDGGSSESDVLVPALAEEAEDVVAFAPAQGILDPTFGVQGIEITSLGSSDEYGLSAALQPDGCILAAGATLSGNRGVCVVRYRSDGKRDASFGNDGVVVTRLGSSSGWGRAVLVQPDGRIAVACDYYRTDILDFETALVRYLADGSLDPSFGGNGVVTTPTGPGDAWTSAAALQPAGEILVLTSKAAPTGSEVRLFRYRPDGSLDPAFDDDGCAVLKIGTGNRGTTMALQPDGKILVAGHRTSNGWSYVARFLPDGSLDLSFGQDGIATGYPGSDARALLVTPDGGIVVAGIRGGEPPANNYYLAKFTANGTPDLSFGTVGVREVTSLRADFVTTMALQPDGGILVAGYYKPLAYNDTFVARHDASGELDPSFGSGGIVTFSIGRGHEAIRSMALQPGGAILLAGDVKVGSEQDIALVRLR